ncbi:hypothetical protein BH23ACT3_BH23ACT3_14860 [soil metagenome]
MNNQTRRSLSVVAVISLFAAVGCGGDDSSGGGAAALSDEEFCELVIALEEQNADTTSDLGDEAFLEDIRALRAAAPNDEIRGALGTFEEFLVSVEDLDEDDPEAFGEIFELMESSEFVEAEATLERYSVETCGIEPSGG